MTGKHWINVEETTEEHGPQITQISGKETNAFFLKICGHLRNLRMKLFVHIRGD